MVEISDATDLSLKEAAVVAGVREKTIRHELAARVVKATRRRGRRRFRPDDVVYFSVVRELDLPLDRSLRQDLFKLISGDRERVGRWKREPGTLVLEGAVPVTISTREAEGRIRRRMALLRRGRERIVQRDDVLGGEPIFAGTRISVRFVGERARREAVAVLLEDYPALSEDDIEFARMFVALGRGPGRPRSIRFRRGA